jgi:hypothetical protein
MTTPVKGFSDLISQALSHSAPDVTAQSVLADLVNRMVEKGRRNSMSKSEFARLVRRAIHDDGLSPFLLDGAESENLIIEYAYAKIRKVINHEKKSFSFFEFYFWEGASPSLFYHLFFVIHICWDSSSASFSLFRPLGQILVLKKPGNFFSFRDLLLW